MAFENAYCKFPLCGLARRSPLSDRLPSRIGAFENSVEFPASLPTFHNYLRAAGRIDRLSPLACTNSSRTPNPTRLISPKPFSNADVYACFGSIAVRSGEGPLNPAEFLNSSPHPPKQALAPVIVPEAAAFKFQTSTGPS